MRIHFIVEWAEKRSFIQATICKAMGVDKSNVSRWFAGRLPSERHLIRLAAVFNIKVTDLFTDPKDYWLRHLRTIRGLPKNELDLVRQKLEAHLAKVKKAG